jgi:hypothetical protein
VFLWVGARGHQWRSLQVRGLEDGVYRIALAGAPELSVSIANEAALAQQPPRLGAPRIALRRWDLDDIAQAVGAELVDGRPWDWRGAPPGPELRERVQSSWQDLRTLNAIPAPELVLVPSIPGPTLIDEASPGPHLVTVELGSGIVLGQARVQLMAGQRSEVTIVLTGDGSAIKAPLAGTLFVHPGWGKSGTNLTFQREVEPSQHIELFVITAARMAPADVPGKFRWDAGSVYPGRYVIVPSHLNTSFVLDVGPAGRRDVDLIIEEPAKGRVTVLDENGGRVGTACVRWRRQETGLHGEAEAQWNAAAGVFEFVAPCGAIVVHASQGEENSLEYRDAAANLRLQSGANDVTLTLARSMGIKVELVTLGVPVSLSMKEILGVRIRRAGEVEPGWRRAQARWVPGSDRITVTVAQAGEYELALPSLAGWGKGRTQRVQVEAGQFTPLRIELDTE